MIRLTRLIPVLFVIAAFGCKKEAQVGYRPENLRLSSDRMTPEVLWSFGRISNVQLSPDRTQILFGITYYNIQQNKGFRDLYLLPVAGGPIKAITNTAVNEAGEVWRPDGQKIGYLSRESGSTQLWEMNPDGSGRRQLSDIEDGISGFNYSPDQKRIAFIKEVKVKANLKDKYPDLAKANARAYDDIMYRHWDEWVETFTHVFVAQVNKGRLDAIVDIMEGQPWESPLKPNGGMEQIVWSPDGTKIIYTCRKKQGKDYALSTNSDLYQYDLGTGTTTNLTEGMMGYDINPVFSPNGRYLAWESMERDGYESDKNRLYIIDFQTGARTDGTAQFDQNVQSLVWTNDNKSIYFISDYQATDEIYRYNLESNDISKITSGIHDYSLVLPTGNRLIAVRHSMSKPDEIYRVDPATGETKEISFVNKSLLDQLAMGHVESRWVTTTDQKQMKVWVIYPPGFDPSRKYPTLLFCEGGPQSTVSQFWSYRWNFQIMAAKGYIVVAPNRRGLPGFGKEWLEQISGDYGGQNMLDYFSAIDTVAAEPYVDKNRLGAVGASYGGFSIYWLAGHHNGRFKAFIAHDGIFNLEANYLETEEMWFVNWDLGGPYWDSTNLVAQRSYASSPHRFVDKWDTPILVIHGEKDYRISYTQGMQAFNAARLKNIPARLLLFPEENHWVLSAQNGILWQREFFGWLDKYLKE
ncbi:MAG: S9 family peptidase [Porphyromonadaceae bacterium]|nr:MAG: S9 family peptidase [Porphyromonadaceae bacterium]